MSHTIRGSEYISRFENFKLLGRDKDLERISSILMRKKQNSLLLVGPAGVGTSSLILGLQYVKSLPGTPFDIINKRFIWLDTDSLFSSGDSNEINEEFQKILRMLVKTPESVLIIEDTYDFIEASRNSGNPHFINALSAIDRNGGTQVILEVRDEQLTQVLKWHSDISNSYTMYDVKEPTGEHLFEIANGIAKDLSSFHQIPITEDAVHAAIELTSKYRDGMGLGGAQPQRSIALLDRALSTYRQMAHRKHPNITRLEAAIASEKDSSKAEAMAADLETRVASWNELKSQIKLYHDQQRDGEEAIYKLSDELDGLVKKQEARREKDEERQETKTFAQMASTGGFDTPEIQKVKLDIEKVEHIISSNKKKHDDLVEAANIGLELNATAVRYEFSLISGISADKLSENEMESLRHLEANLMSRVFGQDEAVKHIANSIKVSKVDTMEESGPAASYLLLGPSGVGKTEIAKAVAQFYLGDEKSLVRFDMSEYMEKHAVAKLIGAPPGYEGFEAGGILTNSVRKKPVGVYLFDEIEKAHPDVYNVFLQILSDGRLTDNVGRTVDFSEIIIIMTSNIGQECYLDESLSWEEAKGVANSQLAATYRSELLNRFNGRENILHFKRLPIEVIERIIAREVKKLNDSYTKRGLSIAIEEDCIQEFCKAHYNPAYGARGLPGYIKANLRPVIVNHILDNPDQTGTFTVGFNTDKNVFEVQFEATV